MKDKPVVNLSDKMRINRAVENLGKEMGRDWAEGGKPLNGEIKYGEAFEKKYQFPSETPNHLAAKYTLWDRIIELTYSLVRGAKKLTNAILVALIVYLACVGLASHYFGLMYWKGYMELTLISNNEVTRYAKEIEAPKKQVKK